MIDVFLPMFYEKANYTLPQSWTDSSNSIYRQHFCNIATRPVFGPPVSNQTKLFKEQMALVGRKWRIHGSLCGEHYQRPQKPVVSFWSADANLSHCAREIVDAAKRDCFPPLCANVQDYLHLYSGHRKCFPKYSIIVLVCVAQKQFWEDIIQWFSNYGSQGL